jgi:hypothetical protein
MTDERRPDRAKHAYIDAERGEEGMWTAEGLLLPFASDSLPIASELAGRLMDWQYRYSQEPDETFDWADFSREGLALAREIKAQLPDWTIVYWDHHKSHIAREQGIEDKSYYEYEIVLSGSEVSITP